MYAERHAVTTNQFGLFTLSIGGGSVLSGTFSTINWGSGNKYIRTSVDLAGGTTYVLMGMSQLLSVPYALYSGNGIDRVSGDTLFLGNGDQYLIPGITKIPSYSWQLVVGGKCYKLVAGPSGKLFVPRYTDMLKSTDNGTTWSNANWTLGIIRDGYSLLAGSIYNFVTNQLIQCALDNGYWVSNNDGNSFVQTGPTGFGTGGPEMLQLSNGRVLGTMGGFQRGLYKSNNLNNNTWTNRYPGTDTYDFVDFGNNLIFSGTNNYLLKSTDMGDSWTSLLNDNITDVEKIQDSLFWVNSQGNVYVANVLNINSSVTPRSNIGAGWFDAKYDTNTKTIVLTKQNTGIFVSKNNGKTWTSMTIPGVTTYNDVSFYQGKVYIGTDKGLYSAIVTN